MEIYVKQSKPSARTLSARAGHGQQDMAKGLQAYRNRTTQFASIPEEDDQALQGKFAIQRQEEVNDMLQGKFVMQFSDPFPQMPDFGDEEEEYEDTHSKKKFSGKGGHGVKLPSELQGSELGSLYHKLKQQKKLPAIFEEAGLDSGMAPVSADQNIDGKQFKKIRPILERLLKDREIRGEEKTESRKERSKGKKDTAEAKPPKFAKEYFELGKLLKLSFDELTRPQKRFIQNRFENEPDAFQAEVEAAGLNLEQVKRTFELDLEDDSLSEESPTQLKSGYNFLLKKYVTQLQRSDKLMQQKVENQTGLPDQLKAGVENLSGYSLDAVKVHYNSPKPAQLQAYAYTQGTDIHVGPGQERYLGHEAWHVVQQMQGRVQPTTQLQGVAVNDNEGLEREADVMGEKVKYGEVSILE